MSLDRTSPVPLYHQLRLVFQQQIQAGAWLPESQIPTEEFIASQYSLKRLRLADGEPMGIQTVFLPKALVPGIEQEDFSEKSLYATLASRYGLTPARAREEHFAVALEAADAELLSLSTGSPGLAAERVAYRRDGSTLELTLSLMCGDRYKIALNLTDCETQ